MRIERITCLVTYNKRQDIAFLQCVFIATRSLIDRDFEVFIGLPMSNWDAELAGNNQGKVLLKTAAFGFRKCSTGIEYKMKLLRSKK